MLTIFFKNETIVLKKFVLVGQKSCFIQTSFFGNVHTPTIVYEQITRRQNESAFDDMRVIGDLD